MTDAQEDLPTPEEVLNALRRNLASVRPDRRGLLDIIGQTGEGAQIIAKKPASLTAEAEADDRTKLDINDISVADLKDFPYDHLIKRFGLEPFTFSNPKLSPLIALCGLAVFSGRFSSQDKSNAALVDKDSLKRSGTQSQLFARLKAQFVDYRPGRYPNYYSVIARESPQDFYYHLLKNLIDKRRDNVANQIPAFLGWMSQSYDGMNYKSKELAATLSRSFIAAMLSSHFTREGSALKTDLPSHKDANMMAEFNRDLLKILTIAYPEWGINPETGEGNGVYLRTQKRNRTDPFDSRTTLRITTGAGVLGFFRNINSPIRAQTTLNPFYGFDFLQPGYGELFGWSLQLAQRKQRGLTSPPKVTNVEAYQTPAPPPASPPA